MAIKRKEKFAKAALILNGFLFLLGGILFLNGGELVFGIIQILAAAPNFILISNQLNFKIQRIVTGATFLLNALVALTVCVDYINSGSNYIQYVWMFAAAVSVLAFFIYMKKVKSINEVHS